MAGREDYKVQLEVFEGPLDLLLYLIKKDEVDVYDIPIERVTQQYLQYLSLMQMLDLNIAGEFLVMAATLMMIKSRMLLPVEERPELEEEEDPRWDLVRQLVEYKKFKDAAQHLEGWRCGARMSSRAKARRCSWGRSRSSRCRTSASST
jgi:segregation and condensation protein A